MGKFFLLAVSVSVVYGALSGNLGAVSASALGGAGKAVELSIELLGTLCFWSGLMKAAEGAGITKKLCFALSPLLRLIFPSLRDRPEVMEPISMNVAANMLGMGNAATPLGIFAMRKLRELSPGSEYASPEMVSFVVMNTASLQILPTTVASLRMRAGAVSPLNILPAVWLVSFCALFVGIICAKVFYKKEDFR